MLSFSSDISVENSREYTCWRFTPPIPSNGLLGTIGAPHAENYLVVGEAWMHLVTQFLEPGDTLLDIGCGCGRTARFLLCYPELRYVGIDVFLPSIRWCTRWITPMSKNRFRFEHVDAHSEHYNPKGRLAARDIRFPVPADSVNLAIASSLFTHLLEDDARHYLAEAARTLARNGKLIASIHNKPAPGTVFSGEEDKIDIAPHYFLSMARDAGLLPLESIGEFCGQYVFVFEKR